MKYVIFSFDDGRLDTFSRALPIMQQYGIKATLNVTTDFIINPREYGCFASGNNESMSIEQICEMEQKGYEIACHGNKHNNEAINIIEGINKLKSWGIKTDEIGFASPFSYITEKNFNSIQELVNNKTIKYVRSGKQVRREGRMHTIMYGIEELTLSSKLFYSLNRSLIITHKNNNSIYFGISIRKRTTVEQLKYLFNQMPQESYVILIFHSILNKSDQGYGKDNWYWDEKKFRKICENISNNVSLAAITTIEMVKRINDV